MTLQNHLSRIGGRTAVRALIAASLGLALSTGFAAARDGLALSTPVEVGESQWGNYLAALVAGADRDTPAAATYFREALRADPRNPELIERAFAAALANGNMTDAFQLSDRLLTRDSNNSLAAPDAGGQGDRRRPIRGRPHTTGGRRCGQVARRDSRLADGVDISGVE